MILRTEMRSSIDAAADDAEGGGCVPFPSPDQPREL